jgi:peptidoglycan biosynthesis protein MviN/MurJ (putative lipid II flippase)
VVASFQYAVRLMELPQAVRRSTATYLLPALSGLTAEKSILNSNELSQGGSTWCSNLLASVLSVLPSRHPLLFERGNSTPPPPGPAWRSLVLKLLAMFSECLARHYALGDTRTYAHRGVLPRAQSPALLRGVALQAGRLGPRTVAPPC